MPSLHVCSLARLPAVVAETGASHVATLISEGTVVERPASIAPERHLFLGFHDIVEEAPGLKAPAERDVAAFLDFVGGWDRSAPMVIHCWAGVSRSTAGAFIAACALRPDLDEGHLAALVREYSPSATPNLRLVRFGDGLLGRGGRMVAAIEAIGRGEDCYEGVPFALALDRADARPLGR